MGLTGFVHRLRHGGRIRRLADAPGGGPATGCPRCDAELALIRRILAATRRGPDELSLPDERRFLDGVRARITTAARARPEPEAWTPDRLRPALAGAGFALMLVAASVILHRQSPRTAAVSSAVADAALAEVDAGVAVPVELDLDAILSDPELAADLDAA